jgi:hypothetical protein
MTVFWDYRPNDGGSKLLRNVGQFLPDYTAQHPKRKTLHTVRRENLKSYILFSYFHCWSLMCNFGFREFENRYNAEGFPMIQQTLQMPSLKG